MKKLLTVIKAILCAVLLILFAIGVVQNTGAYVEALVVTLIVILVVSAIEESKEGGSPFWSAFYIITAIALTVLTVKQ